MKFALCHAGRFVACLLVQGVPFLVIISCFAVPCGWSACLITVIYFFYVLSFALCGGHRLSLAVDVVCFSPVVKKFVSCHVCSFRECRFLSSFLALPCRVAGWLV